MGYGVIIFVILLAAVVVIAAVVTYGTAKDSQTASLKARNIYADIKTGQAQTGLTIVNTCLSGSGGYTSPPNAPGFHILNLTVKNNGSIVLNSTRGTVLYNTSYINFNVTSAGNVWTPLINASLVVSNIYLGPNIPPPTGPELRILVAAENGVSAIAPTSPTNFEVFNVGNKTDIFTWNPSNDDKGIDYYLIYKFDNSAPSQCPWEILPSLIIAVAGNQTSKTAVIDCGPPCPARYFFMTAIDLDGNMAIQSRAVKCNGNSPGYCNH